MGDPPGHDGQALPFLGLLNLCLQLPPVDFRPLLPGNIHTEDERTGGCAFHVQDGFAETGQGARAARFAADLELQLCRTFSSRGLQ